MRVVGAWQAAIVLGCAFFGTVHAERQQVLRQIDPLQNSTVVREQYLPQLMSGPGAVAWSPDSHEVIYSMAGSLWRQRTDSTVATQVTNGPGYDYQPDWSVDGRSIVYTSYIHDALELWLLDLPTGRKTKLTEGGAVNVEPRFSPDGKRLAWVSTAFNRRFHIFVAGFTGNSLSDVTRLTGEEKGPAERQYYSEFNHEISPVWARDGQSMIYVSNRGRRYGSGGIWQVAVAPGAVPRELHYEETNWRTRPEISPDGSRIVYSSYLGRNWMQLWMLPAAGGDELPVSYGDWDEVGVRWSPDGRELAFISNRNGNTELWMQSVVGGAQRQLKVTERKYLQPMGRIELVLRDEHGAPMSARLAVTDAVGRFYAPNDAWVHADDEFDRKERSFEAHYFHSRADDSVDVPAGEITVEIMRGFEHPLERRKLNVAAGATVRLESTAAARLDVGIDKDRWVGGDVHVHINFGGNYRATPERVLAQAAAEDLSIVHALIVNREQRVPDIEYSGRGLDPASTADRLLQFGQEYHTHFWGHLGLLGGTGGALTPGYAAYPNTAVASASPTNGDIADLAHARGALVGYVHPFHSDPQPFVSTERLSKELPVDVALGKVDYLEILGFSDHRSTAGVWYRLLNLGFRLPAAAGGSDAMANFAAMHGPLGLNRVYARVPAGPLDMGTWLAALKAGHTFATNGPLLRFSLDGQEPGGEVVSASPRRAVRYSGSLRSIVPVDHLEVVCDGKVVRKVALSGKRTSADFSGTTPLTKSGWCLLRASSERAEHPILDNYVYATTSPVYVTIDGRKPRSPDDARYFMAWMDRVTEATERYPHWNSPDEKRDVMAQIDSARAVYAGMQ